MSVGLRLKALRQNRQPKVTQEDVANAVGVSRAAYSNWELGRALPDLHQAGLLADYYHISVDFLLGRESLESQHVSDPLFERIFTLDEAKRKAIETLLDIEIKKDEEKEK